MEQSRKAANVKRLFASLVHLPPHPDNQMMWQYIAWNISSYLESREWKAFRLLKCCQSEQREMRSSCHVSTQSK